MTERRSRKSFRLPNLLRELALGDMVLLGARPRQGKTVLALELLLDAAIEGRRSVFFTLECADRDVLECLRTINPKARWDAIEIVASDDICGDTIVDHLSDAQPGTIAVVDYLQILDQDRRKPTLSDQLLVLGTFARETGIILVFLSQIDRTFDPERELLPGFRHVRQPNPIPPGIFSKTCFLHDGKCRLEPAE